MTLTYNHNRSLDARHKRYNELCATAIAWAQHYSDLCDHVAGVYKMPEFVARVDVR